MYAIWFGDKYAEVIVKILIDAGAEVDLYEGPEVDLYDDDGKYNAIVFTEKYGGHYANAIINILNSIKCS